MSIDDARSAAIGGRTWVVLADNGKSAGESIEVSHEVSFAYEPLNWLMSETLSDQAAVSR